MVRLNIVIWRQTVRSEKPDLLDAGYMAQKASEDMSSEE